MCAWQSEGLICRVKYVKYAVKYYNWPIVSGDYFYHRNFTKAIVYGLVVVLAINTTGLY